MIADHEQLALRLARDLSAGVAPEEALGAIAASAGHTAHAAKLRLAADAIRKGADLPEVLGRYELLPARYLAPLEWGAEQALPVMIGASRRVTRFWAKARGIVLGLLGLLLVLWVIVALGTHLALAGLVGVLDEMGRMQAAGEDISPLFRASSAGLRFVFGPFGLGLAAVLFGIAFVRPRWVFRLCLVRGSDLVQRAAACRSLQALLEGGMSAPEAAALAGRVSGSNRLEGVLLSASRRMERGVGSAEALRASGLVTQQYAGLWEVGEQQGTLDTVAGSMAEILEAQSATRQSTLAHALQLRYALVAGLVASWAVGTVWIGVIEVMTRW